MNILYQDLLSIQEGILVQQVNCRGAMGRGLAKSIREKWPQVYISYHAAYQRGEWQLGMVQFVQVGANLQVCNLAGQDNWGAHKQQTDYRAYRAAWPKVKHRSAQCSLPVYAPWLFGCGLAGGDWNIVQPMIEEACPDITWVRHDRAAGNRPKTTVVFDEKIFGAIVSCQGDTPTLVLGPIGPFFLLRLLHSDIGTKGQKT